MKEMLNMVGILLFESSDDGDPHTYESHDIGRRQLDW